MNSFAEKTIHRIGTISADVGMTALSPRQDTDVGSKMSIEEGIIKENVDDSDGESGRSSTVEVMEDSASGLGASTQKLFDDSVTGSRTSLEATEDLEKMGSWSCNVMQPIARAMSDDTASMNVLVPYSQHDVTDIIQIAGTPELNRSETHETREQARSSDNSPPVTTITWEVKPSLPEACIVCYGDAEEQGTLIRTCQGHDGTHFYHAECIKNLFLAACKNESLMPPSCCAPIKLSIGLSVLSALERELFMAKYEEWSATDRVYCPIVSCSAFIPKRMIPGLKFETIGHERLDHGELHASVSGSAKNLSFEDTHYPPEVLHAENSLAKSSSATVLGVEPVLKICASPIDRISLDTPVSQFSCPKCKGLLCAFCKQLSHPNEPCVADNTGIDPVLLERLGIKRCPKCAQGIRIMFGCSHVRCRCGAHFCSRCMQSWEKCGNYGCHPIFPEAGIEPGEVIAETTTDPIERDLDEADDWDESGLNFGEEPSPDEYFDPWGCYHIWSGIKESRHDNETKAICHFCWEAIEIQNAEAGSSMLTCHLCRAAACRNCTENMAASNTSGELKEYRV